MIKFGRFLPIILALIFSLTTFAATPAALGTNSQPAAARKNPEAPESNSRNS